MSTATVAARIVRAMEAKGYSLDRKPGEVNIIYVEGATFKVVGIELAAERNDNKPNLWNDVRVVLQFVNGAPVITDWWQATTEPGTRYTMNPVSGAVAEGAARITLGPQKCWQVGLHRGYEALSQTGDVVMVTRDKNKDFSRTGDKVTKGFYGINQHHGFDAPADNIGPHSAGCLVGRTVKGHREFMALAKTDPRYLANRKFVYTTTILEALDVVGVPEVLPSRPVATAPAQKVEVLIDITSEDFKKIFPRAPQIYIDGLAAQVAALHRAGITATRTRLGYCLANVEHECAGFTIPNLTENINYTPERMAVVFKARVGSAANVRAKFGTTPGWQKKAFDVLYGNRMGNRLGTDDGSRFIGRGAPQITGRDGYREVGTRAAILLEDFPEAASEPNNQSPIIAAFWLWKGLNKFADAGNWTQVVKLWNGGTNGMADRNVQLAGNDPILKRLQLVKMAMPVLQQTPGGPTPGQPPKAATDAATANERKARTGGGAAAGAGGAGEAANAGTQQPDKAPVFSPLITYTLIVVGVVVFVVAAILIARKVKAVKDNWV